MQLTGLVQEFLAQNRDRLRSMLAAKYGISSEEMDEVRAAVDRFLEKNYGAAVSLAEEISEMQQPVMLFIGREDCAICQESKPAVLRFAGDHREVRLVKLDYSEPAGRMYHILHQEDKGLLPLTALIYRGCVRMLFTGKPVPSETLESYYRALKSGSPDHNVFAL
ncbi:MAG: hypothetical protein GKC10_09335 [Methanosarcinales archaeon]|nr:hypothetical protein [Methanosarcinales archaeon]